MSKNYHCPRCHSYNIEKLKYKIYCSSCDLHFDKKFLRFLEDDDILADEELEGVIAVFDDDLNDMNNITPIF